MEQTKTTKSIELEEAPYFNYASSTTTKKCIYIFIADAFSH
jgi:hypothetical protein